MSARSRRLSCLAPVLLVAAFPLRAGAVVDWEGSAQGGTNFAGLTTHLISNAATSATVTVMDANTGQGAGSASGSLAMGMLTATSHACGEPPVSTPLMPFERSSDAGVGDIFVSESYRITSPTLPVGTPFQFTITAIAGIKHQEQALIVSTSDASDTANLQFSAVIGSQTFVTSGSYSYSASLSHPNGVIMGPDGGLFGAQPDKATFNAHVGDSLSIGARVQLGSNCDVDPGDIGDVQLQASLVFGGLSDTQGINITSFTDGTPFPGTTLVSRPTVDTTVPEPIIPFDTPDTPEPISSLLAASLVVPAFTRRRNRGHGGPEM